MRPNKRKKEARELIGNDRKSAARDASPSLLKRLLNKFYALVNAPFFNVAALVVLFLSVLTGIRCLRSPENPAQLAFVERPGYEAKGDISSEHLSNPAPDIFSGEVYYTSIRLRETGALGMAMSLTIFAEYSEKGRIPSNLENILRAVQSRNLLPPGFSIQNGEVFSETSTYRVNFQSQPLKFEILSIPQSTNKSPALLMQFPLVSFDGKTITYFQSISAAHFGQPAPFASAQQIVAAGWSIEQWRGSALPKTENLLSALAEEKQKLGADRSSGAH